MDDDIGLDEQAQSSDDEDIGIVHISKVNLRQDWWKHFEEERPATPEPAWSIPLSDVPIPTNNWASALASNYSPPPEDSLLAQTGDIATFMDWHNVSKPLPLGGPPGQITIQSDFFFNKDLEYLRYGRKGSRPALSILKMKAAYYPDAGLEQMVPNRFWIEEECKYDIVAMYDYMKKIVLCHVDLNEHVIAERDFKYLYPSDFEDLYLLNLQGHLNHLPWKDKKILTTAINQWTRHLDATGFEYKHDYTVIDFPKVVMFQDKYGVQMMMRFNEIHKSSDGTLQQIDEALDYRVKEFRINRMNPCLNTSTRSCVMQGAFLTHGKASTIPTIFSWGGNISPEGFLPSILLLAIIIVAIAIIVIVVLVVVDAIIGEAIKFIFHFLDLSSRTIVIVKSLFNLVQGTSSKCYFVFLGTIATRKYQFSPFKLANEPNFSFRTIEVERLTGYELFIVSFSAIGASLGPVFLLVFLVFSMLAVCVSRAVVTLSATNFLMAA
nr:hypothetical protein [Tanacetum cinerariifolium]